MRIENLKDDFPGMPRDMRMMVEREVAKQLRAVAPRRKSRMGKRAAAAAVAAAMVLGTTVFAGALYRMRSSADSTYGADIRIEKSTAGAETASGEGQGAAPVELLPVQMDVSYLPEGMVEVDDSGKYCYADAMYQGGVSICLYGMDTGDDQFAMSFENVISREDITVNGYDGVYLEFSRLFEDEISFNQRIYVAYPDLHYVLEMFIASDVTREEAVRIAEGITLKPAQAGEEAKCISSSRWSAYLAAMTEADAQEPADDAVLSGALENTHAVGEGFPLKEGLTVKVSQVEVTDNIGMLDLSRDADLRAELARETNADGTLLPCEAVYIKSGNGTDALAEIVETRQLPQKLVCATLEYTNTGSETMTDVLFFCSLMKLAEADGRAALYDGAQPDETAQWDKEQINGAAHYLEMYYYDVEGTRQGKNYIPCIEAGETVTVHVAWVVPERDLPYLYLNLNTGGTPYELTPEDMAIGYVDIRR